MPFRRLFLSRWSALLWAAGIVWTAVDTVGFAPETPNQVIRTAGTSADDNGQITAKDVARLAEALKNS